ncbi:transcription initiation factor IIF, beta subunit-domain-containing protein [Absidia repens]|uniref:Transcription initiation factor IIF subunit beta n=1 Tax=Absidia repens TaxID=90262 RepID=A0A1X2IJA9_9FUNG|nr:transcription initiation factor IIF, beta subunit-domain-containing protein [Absidia repens]
MSVDNNTPNVDALFEEDPGSLAGLEDDDDLEDLDLKNLDTKIWLVKVPKFLAAKWNSVDEENTNLGSVRIYSETPPGRSSAISLILPEDTEDIPKEYTIKISPDAVQNRYIFTQNEHGSRYMRGKVHHDCTATPSQFGMYRNIMRKRVHEAGMPQRTVQVLGQDNQPVFAPGASSAMQSTGFSDFITAKKPKTEKEKATRMPHNELMDLLFAAFERYPYWSFKGIVEHTRQPAQYLKDVLTEICILNKRGPYAGNYQLKPEYKHRESQAEKEGTEKARINQALVESDDEDDVDDEEEMEEIKY